MIQGRRVLAIIPARGGSKGVPRKNIRSLTGKPLIAWTVEEAKKSQYIDRLIVSSEDAEIIRTAQHYGCEAPFVRPVELAADETSGIDPVLHALETLPEHYDLVVLLQPTSPLRTVDDIDGCIRRCVEQGAPFCVSVTEVDKHPFWMFTLPENNVLQPLLPADGETRSRRRQDLPPVYVLNGAVYVADTQQLQQHRTFVTADTAGYVMPKERSADIDTETDFLLCDILLRKRHENLSFPS
jgi:CMP-N,N'-diacetyllegionaminic acid synthase